MLQSTAQIFLLGTLSSQLQGMFAAGISQVNSFPVKALDQREMACESLDPLSASNSVVMEGYKVPPVPQFGHLWQLRVPVELTGASGAIAPQF